MPLVADRLATLDGVVERAVQDRRGHLLAQLAGHVAHGLQQAVQLEAILGGGEDDRRIVQEEEPLLHPLAELGQRREALLAVVPVALLEAPGLDFLLPGLAHILGHQVPLVHHDNAGPALLDDHVGDLLVLLGDPVERVDDQHGDVAPGDGILGPLDRAILDGVVDAPGLAHTRGVDQHVAFAARLRHDLEGHVDGVAGGSRDRADDHPLGTGQPIDDGGLAHVGPSHDGQALRTGGSTPGNGLVRQVGPGFFASRNVHRPVTGVSIGGLGVAGFMVGDNRRRLPTRQERHGGIHEVLDPVAVDRGHREDALEPEG